MSKESRLFISLVIALYLILVSPFSNTMDSIPSKQEAVFIEALKIVEQRAVFFKQPITSEELKTDLQDFLSRHDKYAQFLSQDEYRQFKEHQKESYIGLGMELEKNTEGDVFCFPYPGSPSQNAGIQRGDKLLTINNQDVSKKPLFSISALATGKIGSQVELLVSTAKDKPRKVIVRLSKVQAKSVSSQWLDDSILIIKIVSFSAQTKFDLAKIIDRVPSNKFVVFDLRGNPGGDFYVALECADLFIPEGKLLATAIGKDKKIDYRGSQISKYVNSNIFIWQDHGTASAAEVFASAMSDNKAAILIGEKSYGKGTKQNIFELRDGAALIITTEYILTPSGIRYDGIGVLPKYSLNKRDLNFYGYFKKVTELISDVHKK
jgi:carboxyl-terminal processing protease